MSELVAVFTYGSLMFDAVWSRVVQARVTACEGHITGFERRRVAQQTYPGLVRAPQCRVSGRLYCAVPSDDLARLDAFEGSAYQRISVAVTVTGLALPVNAETYLFNPGQPSADSAQTLTDEPWLPETFDLERFLREYCAPRQL